MQQYDFEPLDRKWYASTTRGGGGALAVMHLERQGFQAYSPVVAETRIERGKSVVRKLQLFPGYVFIGLDIGVERWQSVNGTIGCGRLLGGMGDGLPKALPKGFVEELQGLQHGGRLTAVRADAVVYRYQKHDGVRVRSGPWEGHTGSFSKYRKGSLVLLMTLFSRGIELEFKPHECVPASPKAA